MHIAFSCDSGRSNVNNTEISSSTTMQLVLPAWICCIR